MNLSGFFKIALASLFILILGNPVKGQEKKSDKIARDKIEAEGYFFDATKAEMLEKPLEAIQLYEKSLSKDPENAAAHYKIASLLSRQSKAAEAVAHAKQACKLGKENYYYWIQYAQLLEETGEWKPSIKAYRYLVDNFPEQQQYRLSLAQVFIRNRKYKDALKELDKAREFLGPSNDLFQLRQRLFLQQNNLNGAVEDGYKWISLLPEEPDPYFSLAQLLISNNRSEEGKKILFQMGERFPSNPTAHLMLADIFFNNKEEEKAEQEMIKAFSSPDLPIGAKIDIVSGYLRGMDTEEEKRKAIALCDLILQVHPEDARAYIIRGDILNRADDKRGAREMYLKAKNKDKNNFGLWEQMVLIDLNLNEIDSVIRHTAEAKILFPNTPTFAFYNGLGNLMKKNYSDAVESLEHAKRISLENREMQLEICSQLGDAYYNLKQKEKAFQAFDDALLLDSNNSHVLNNYSYFLSLEKYGLEKALKMSSRLVTLFPNDPTFLDTHGWVLYQLGNYNGALEPLEKASKDSRSGVIWEHFGDALFKLGRIAEARNAWKKASEFGGEVSGELPAKMKNTKTNQDKE